MIVSNYHIHTSYCDGQADAEAFVQAALQQGLQSIGFSSHAPLPFATRWCMLLDKLPQYLDEIGLLKLRYASQIEIYAGLELDYVPGIEAFRQQHILSQALDYVIGSVHLVGAEFSALPWTVDGPTSLFDDGVRQLYHGDVQALVLEYYRRTRAMLQEGGIDIVGHLDRILYNNIARRWWDETAPWYRAAVEETLQAIAARNMLVELNLQGLYAPLASPNPSAWVLRRCHELGIRIVVTTDAHRPERVASGLERAQELLLASGYRETWRLRAGRWQVQPL
jgi:histidinol-phosphatase (PHP family)